MNNALLAPSVLALAASAAAQVTQSSHTFLQPSAAGGSTAAHSVAWTSSGDVVLAGVDVGSLPNPARQPLVARIAASGAIVWSAPLATPAFNDSGWAVAIDANDDSARVLSGSNAGSAELRVTKLTSAGSIAWSTAHVAAATQYEQIRLLVDAAGISYAAATSIGSSSGAIDVLVQSYDASGGLRWSRTLDGATSSNDELAELALGPSGLVVVAGRTDVVPATGASSMWLVALDAAGQVAWSRTRAPVVAAFSEFRDVACAPTGTIHALGFSAGSAPNVRDELVAYDAAGSLSWSQPLPAGRLYTSIAADAAGSVYAIASGDAATPTARLAKYSSSGLLLFERDSDPSWGVVHYDQVRVDPSGDVTVVASLGDSPRILRYEPDGDARWTTAVVTPNGVTSWLADVAIGPAGTAVVAGSQYVQPPTGPIALRALVARFEPQSHSICIGDGVFSPCPCGNASANGRQAGCANSSGSGARLADGGIASVANDTLVLSVGGETPNAPTVVIQGTASAGSAAFGDGLRCAGGAVLRLYTRTASAGALAAPGPGDPSVTARSAALGQPIAAGSIRVYQSYYRDPSPSFCPAPSGNTWNLSNGLLVRWGI